MQQRHAQIHAVEADGHTTSSYPAPAGMQHGRTGCTQVDLLEDLASGRSADPSRTALSEHFSIPGPRVFPGSAKAGGGGTVAAVLLMLAGEARPMSSRQQPPCKQLTGGRIGDSHSTGPYMEMVPDPLFF